MSFDTWLICPRLYDETFTSVGIFTIFDAEYFRETLIADKRRQLIIRCE